MSAGWDRNTSFASSSSIPWKPAGTRSFVLEKGTDISAAGEKTRQRRVALPLPHHWGAVLLTVGRSYVGNDVTPSTLLDRACACSYENLPKYRSYRVSNTAPGTHRQLFSWELLNKA